MRHLALLSMRLVVHVPAVFHPEVADATLQAPPVIRHQDTNRCDQLVCMCRLCAGDSNGSVEVTWVAAASAGEPLAFCQLARELPMSQRRYSQLLWSCGSV